MLPASLYLTATPRFQYVGFVPVACLLLAAYAVRRDRVWPGGLLVAGGVVFWSVVAPMLAFPILFHVLVGGHRHRDRGRAAPQLEGAGLRPGRDRRGFAGALLTFGDAPFLMRHPSLNPCTLSVLAAVLLVTALGVVDKRVFRN